MMNLFVTWDVSPEMLKIGSLTLRYYGFLFILGFIIAYFILKWMFRHSKVPADQVDMLVVVVFFAGIIGGRLGHVFFYEPAYYIENPGKIFKIWEGGVASHGAGLMLFAVLAVYAAVKKWNLLWLLDRLAVPVALGSAFIRLGNLMNSEIYGYETSLPWGFIFSRNGETVPKHPTQIYEALCYLAVFVLLFLLYRKYRQETPRGLLIGWFLTLFLSARFLVEFAKQPQVEFESSMFLNMGQLLSIPFIAGGVIMLVFAYKKRSISRSQSLKMK
jgi:phosphatidylglycerol---prolipoprotein diacylglyceryl transferase